MNDLTTLMVEYDKNKEMVAKLLLKMSKLIIKQRNFQSYTWKSDMISDAMSDCFTYIHNYCDKKAQGCAEKYFTLVIKNAFIKRIKKEKRIIDFENLSFIEFLKTFST